MNYNPSINRFCFFLLILFYHVCSAETVDICYNDLISQNSFSSITCHEVRDLELFESPNQSHNGILSVFDTTYTESGKACLRYHLRNPRADVALLHRRQQQIKLLLEKPELLEEIKALLARIKTSEKDLLYFINHQEDPVARTAINSFYFKNAWLKDFNKSSVALDVRNYLKQLGLFGPVVEHLIFHFALSYIQEKLTHDHHDHDHCNHHAHVSHHHHYCVHDLEASGDSSVLVKGAFTALKAAHLGIHVMSVKDIIEQMGTERTLVNQLYKKVASVRDALQAMATLNVCLQENRYNENAFAYHSPVVIGKLTSSIKLFDELLGETYFDSTSSLGYVSRIGNTLYHYQQLQDKWSTLQRCMERVGDIDALVSIVEWYKEQINKKTPVCFVQFVNSATPVIELEKMWHVGLDADRAVMNDISMRADKGAYKFIITGPNKAGKSTLIKAVGLNIVLAQAFGIAAAQKAELTPFHKLISYITVTDDIAHDRSTFVAELVRAEECIQTLQSLSSEQHACLLIDDSLFKGTTFEKSEDMALRFLTTLGTFSNSCALIATHCRALTKLEQQMPTVFKNYRIKMGIDEQQGNPRSMFMLEEGIADQAAVFDIIQRHQPVSF